MTEQFEAKGNDFLVQNNREFEITEFELTTVFLAREYIILPNKITLCNKDHNYYHICN